MGAPRNPLTTGNPLKRLDTKQREDARLHGIHRHFRQACDNFFRERCLDARHYDEGIDQKPEPDEQ